MKVWGVIFTCLKTRAVHLEYVESLSLTAFIATLIRFQARRPGVRVIYCDCGTNFCGAEKILENAVKEVSTVGGRASGFAPIEWRFLPRIGAGLGNG